MDLQSHVRAIANHPHLSPAQKQTQIAQLADQSLDYPEVSLEAQQALTSGLICDLHEGHAPYKPRYVLPDYREALNKGCEYLELAPPTDLDEAIQFLMIMYHHVPSVTGFPVYLGDIDQLLLPYIKEDMSEDYLYKKLRLFWQYLDRTLPDAFMHANIGPINNRVAKVILKVDRDLQQATPNLTCKYDYQNSTSIELLSEAITSIIHCNKPHIANHQLICKDFPEGYGVASCYNSLPLGGGAFSLVRLNLAESFKFAIKEYPTENDIEECYIQHVAPRCADLLFEILEARINYLVEQSGFFDNHFLAKEGFISIDRFTAMFGIFGLAELVNSMMELKHAEGRYGHDEAANKLGERIVGVYADLIQARKVRYCRNQQVLFHAQSGISSDIGVTEGTRITTGEEPETLSHILAVLPMHQYFAAGISDIFNIDETIERNPLALLEVSQGAIRQGLRMFTANVANRDLVRITGYMVRRSDIEKYKKEGSRLNSTVLGSEAVDNGKVINRCVKAL
ncbi:YjjI family glycine radical enzyme [Zooshikella marina]|uniref:YjjI family glycine radical enzyme n=1 Tax=Zooshikella ganghwensis TaxID=202772 RepID=UPI001BAECE9C|nr:YjjI family glycine radical enzyme [Zooshikella ganghwensis]MBU2709122.1 YjjI family glycine radical enzyme [Zooshikella ganghwensis]